VHAPSDTSACCPVPAFLVLTIFMVRILPEGVVLVVAGRAVFVLRLGLSLSLILMRILA